MWFICVLICTRACKSVSLVCNHQCDYFLTIGSQDFWYLSRCIDTFFGDKCATAGNSPQCQLQVCMPVQYCNRKENERSWRWRIYHICHINIRHRKRTFSGYSCIWCFNGCCQLSYQSKVFSVSLSNTHIEVYVCIRVYECVHVCICVSVYIFMHICLCIYVSMYLCIYVYTDVYMYICN